MESTQSPPRGKRLLALAINQIIEHPETHDQTAWHCGTKHCFGGHVQIMGGRDCDSDYVERDMQELTGLEYEEINWLCSGSRTKSDLHGFVSSYLKGEDYFASAGYSRAGYNRAGYNSAGYNSAGYDRAGYDRAGYDSAGYNSAGYDRAGYDRAGYDRAGYNSAGYNSAGYDRAGYDRAGYDRAGKPLALLEVPDESDN